jgi:ATP-binding protein involved in chromosome partitioning
MGVSISGSIPLDPQIAETSDSGNPIVVSQPQSEIAKGYKKIARDMAAKLSVMSLENSGQFKPITMEWQ